MTRSGYRNFWLRMTDSMGLTEPGKKPAMPRPGVLLFQVILWSAFALISLMMAIRTQGEIQVMNVVLVVISLALTVANLVRLRQSKKGAATSKAD